MEQEAICDCCMPLVIRVINLKILSLCTGGLYRIRRALLLPPAIKGTKSGQKHVEQHSVPPPPRNGSVVML